MKEVEAYRLFAGSPGVIHSVDYSISSDRGDPSSKTVYVLLPYYRRGNLQDLINANLVNHTQFPERHLMLLFLGVCHALRQMHQYGEGAGGVGAGSDAERMEMPRIDGVDENVQVAKGRGGKKQNGDRGSKTPLARETGPDEDHETEQQRPLMHDEEGATGAAGEVRSYAHRDIKPG